MNTITQYRIKCIEYPTICVVILGFLFWLSAIYLRLYHSIHYVFTLPLSSLGVYTLFTPLHEATHNNISSHRVINNIIGNMVIVPFFFANFKTFKYIHLQHHSHTNRPILDPDRFSRFGWISCIWMFAHYNYYYISVICKKKPFNNNILYMGCVYTFIYMCYIYSTLNHIWILWILPSIIATGILAYLFDYLPHRDHTDTIHTTKMTDGCIYFNNGKGNDILSILTCNQLTYHHVHHLYSKIPFYKYKSVWESNYNTIKDDYIIQTVF